MQGPPNTGKVLTNCCKIRKLIIGQLKLQHLHYKEKAEGSGQVQPEKVVAPAGKSLRQSDPAQSMKGISLKNG